MSDCRSLSRSVALVGLLLAPGLASAQQPAAAPAAAATQVAAPPAAPTLPLPNRLNNVLPKWIRVRGELRERMEGFDSLGFTSGRDDSYYLTRLRLNATFQPTPMSW